MAKEYPIDRGLEAGAALVQISFISDRRESFFCSSMGFDATLIARRHSQFKRLFEMRLSFAKIGELWLWWNLSVRPTYLPLGLGGGDFRISWIGRSGSVSPSCCWSCWSWSLSLA